MNYWKVYIRVTPYKCRDFSQSAVLSEEPDIMIRRTTKGDSLAISILHLEKISRIERVI